jgi:hypothetical protein
VKWLSGGVTLLLENTNFLFVENPIVRPRKVQKFSSKEVPL